MLTRGRSTTVPDICAGSSVAMRSSRAMMEAYSVPCAPETRARSAPGFAPRTITTGICVPASTPAGTSMKPVAFWPRSAVAVPTVNVDCCALAESGSKLKEIASASVSRRGMKPPAHEDTAPAAREQYSRHLSPRVGNQTSGTGNTSTFSAVGLGQTGTTTSA